MTLRLPLIALLASFLLLLCLRRERVDELRELIGRDIGGAGVFEELGHDRGAHLFGRP